VGRELRRLAPAAVAFAAAVVVLAEPSQPFRGLAALLLVAVLPGLALTAVLTKRAPWPAERLVVVLASSLAVVIGGGLLLDRLPGGLSEGSWIVLLAYTTVAVVGIGALRPGRGYVTRRLRRSAVPRPTTRQAVLLLAAAGLAATAVGIAKAAAEDARGAQPVVQLWMLQERGPVTTRLSIGVDAIHAPEGLYRLEVRAGDGAPTAWQVPIDGPTNWRAIVELPRGERQRVDARLYAETGPGDAVRHVRQWVR